MFEIGPVCFVRLSSAFLRNYTSRAQHILIDILIHSFARSLIHSHSSMCTPKKWMYWNEKQWVSVLHSIFTHPLSPCFSEGFSSLLLLESNVLLDVSALSYWIFFIVKRRHSFLWNTKTNKCVCMHVWTIFSRIVRSQSFAIICGLLCVQCNERIRKR